MPEHTTNKPPDRVAFLLFGWSIGASRLAPQYKAAAESGFHFHEYVVGAQSKIFNTNKSSLLLCNGMI
jgi:hypothetical protein